MVLDHHQEEVCRIAALQIARWMKSLVKILEMSCHYVKYRRSNLLVYTSSMCRSSPPEVLLWKVVLKISNKFTEEHSCRSVISIKLQSWNHTSIWAFSCKFAACFQNIIPLENLWRAVSVCVFPEFLCISVLGPCKTSSIELFHENN